MPKKSLIWNHFEDLNKEAKCLECLPKIVKLAKNQGSTKGLWDHLERTHKTIFDELKSDDVKSKKKKNESVAEKKSIYQLTDNSESKTTAPLSHVTSSKSSNEFKSTKCAGSSQSSIERFCGPVRQAPQIDRLIFSWLADATLPYTTIDNPQFRLLIETVSQLPYKYSMPHEGKIRLSVGPKAVEAVKWKISEILQTEVVSYCFDTDMWTSPTQTSYLSFVVHFIDSKWSRKMCVLRCKPVYAKHTAENINMELEEIRNEWDLSNDKLHLAIRDSGANMVAAMRIGQVDDVNCFLHLLNLVVTKGILEQRTVKDMVARASNVANDFTYKGELKRAFSDAFKIRCKPPLSFIRHQPTRWNSTYLMLKRIIEVKEELIGATALLEANGVKINQSKLTINDWALLNPLCDLLEAIHEVTLMSEHESSCISEVIPHTKSLCQKMMRLNSRFVETTQESLVTYLQRYLYGKDPRCQYVDIETSSSYCIATILDPRFKQAGWFREETNFETAVERLKAILQVKLMNQPRNDAQQINTPPPAQDDNSAIPVKKSYWTKCMEVLQVEKNQESSIRSINTEAEAERQVSLYLREESIDPDDNPLNFWQLKEKLYPELAKLAKQYLAAPLSSVASEREFKIGKRVITDTRNRLLPENAEKLVWFYYNQRAIDYKLEQVIHEYDSHIANVN